MDSRVECQIRDVHSSHSADPPPVAFGSLDPAQFTGHSLREQWGSVEKTVGSPVMHDSFEAKGRGAAAGRMKFLLHPLLIVSAVLAVAGVARADEISKSAAVSCDPERARFSILADTQADSPNAGPLNASEERNIERLGRGGFVRECNWKGTTVRVSILSWEATNAMCAGVGGAILKSIAINGRELALMDVELSNFRHCHSDEPHPARITVTSESDGEYLYVCLGRWSWEEGWRAAECTKAKVVLEAEQLPAN